MPAAKSTLLTLPISAAHRLTQAYEMYTVFKVLRRAPRGRTDLLARRLLRCSTQLDCPTFLYTSSANSALHLPHPTHSFLTKQSKTVLFCHRSLSLTLHTSAPQAASNIISFPLAQTGEGIKECELTEWYVKVKAHNSEAAFILECGPLCLLFACRVQEGSHVEEFEKICEVQSDKAAVEITSRYPGVIKKLHHSTGDLVQV